MNRLAYLVVVLVLSSGLADQMAAAGDGGFKISPPVVAPAKHEPGVLVTELRELTDAHGLALLVADDAAAKRIAVILNKWLQDYKPLLTSDPVLKQIDTRMQSVFSKMLGDRRRQSSQIRKLIAQAPKEKLKPILIKWMKSLLFRRGVYFKRDLKRISKSDQADICLQTRTMDSLKNLPDWRYRFLTWLYRDRLVRQLFHDRDDRLTFLTPVRIHMTKQEKATREAVERYLGMVHNLRLQVLKNKTLPYDQFRTLEGLMRGLRYMPTIRYACKITGLDHLLMTRLFIQESEFIHQRVSWAGAFSLAQFLNIALKDIWIFKKRIPGALTLLKGIKSFEDLKSKVVADPHMAIKASCVYFRRIRDEVIMRLGKKGRRASQEMVSLMTVEMFALRQGAAERAYADSMIEVGRAWPVKEMVMLPLIPIAGSMMPDAGSMLASWMESTVRDLVQLRLTKGVFEKRMNRLHSAMGLAAYNAGMSNLIKASKRRSPFGPLSLPLQITETRNYVDDILDGQEILHRVGRLASDVEHMSYEDVVELAETACKNAGIKKKK
jgi:hypothetical protein